MRRLMVLFTVMGLASAAVFAASDATAEAKEKRAPLKSCIAALDAAEGVGVKSDLYIVNARRCRSGINTAEKVAKTTSGPYTPIPTDFALSVITLEQSCFGSAGCNVNYRIEVAYVGAQTPAKNKSFQVVYEVTGTEDAQIGSFELKGLRYSTPSEDFVSTPSNPVLAATVTSVIEN